MLRKLLIGFAIIEIIVPRRIIDACERIGLENPNEAQLRPYASTIARLEGLTFLWILVRGRDRAPIISVALASAGAIAIVAPRPLIRLTQHFAYENTPELELRPWVVPATRALGILYLLVVFLSSSKTESALAGGMGTEAKQTA